ncbi:hypothetical protein GN956_G14280 [Arapaima gigas]
MTDPSDTQFCTVEECRRDVTSTGSPARPVYVTPRSREAVLFGTGARAESVDSSARSCCTFEMCSPPGPLGEPLDRSEANLGRAIQKETPAQVWRSRKQGPQAELQEKAAPPHPLLMVLDKLSVAGAQDAP